MAQRQRGTAVRPLSLEPPPLNPCEVTVLPPLDDELEPPFPPDVSPRDPLFARPGAASRVVTRV